MKELSTKYGSLKGASFINLYSDGGLKECILTEYNELKTPLGNFIPQYQDDGLRRKQIKPLSFYRNGNIKNLPLQDKVEIATSVGVLPAELITFYEHGAVKRLFPLDGKLSGFWAEEDEYGLAKEIEFNFSIGSFKRKVIGIQFYENGAVKSIAFWPKDIVTIQSPMGSALARIGISLYPGGKLKSFEPSKPLPVETPLGKIMAYDSKALGIHGETNSLRFSEDGKIENIVTTTNIIEVIDISGNKNVYKPDSKPSMFNLAATEVVPLSIQFLGNKVSFNNSSEQEYNVEDCVFSIKPLLFQAKDSCSSCASCNDCG